MIILDWNWIKFMDNFGLSIEYSNTLSIINPFCFKYGSPPPHGDDLL